MNPATHLGSLLRPPFWLRARLDELEMRFSLHDGDEYILIMSVGALEHLCVDTICIVNNFSSQTSIALLLLCALHVVLLQMSVLRDAPMSSLCVLGAWCLPFPVQHASWLP